MNLLSDLLEHAENRIQRDGFDKLQEHLNELRKILNTRLNEGMIGNHRGDLEKKFDEVENKFIAARRALGLTNKPGIPPEEKAAHRSKIMKYINMFRKELYALMSELEMSPKEIAYHKNRIDLDREFGKPSEFPNYRPNQ